VKDTRELYGHDVPFQTVLSGAVATPPVAVHFVRTCSELFHEGRAHQDK